MTQKRAPREGASKEPSPLEEYLSKGKFSKDLSESLKEAKGFLEEFQRLPQDSDDPEVRKAIRLLNERLRTSYWAILIGVCNSRMQDVDETPESPSFTDSDKLLINYGYLHPALANAEAEVFIQKGRDRAPMSQYQFYMLTDYIKDLHSYYFNRPAPLSSVDKSRTKKVQIAEELVEEDRRKLKALLKYVLQEIDDEETTLQGQEFMDELEKLLPMKTEVALRTQGFRYAQDREQVEMREAASQYDRITAEYGRWLENLRTMGEENPSVLSTLNMIVSISEGIEKTKATAVAIREEEAKDQDKRKRLAAKYKGKGGPELRMEIEERIKQIRSFGEMSAKKGRLVPSPFFQDVPLNLLTLRDLAKNLDKMPDLDPDIFHSVRLRARGFPRICLIPGKGDGIYDWDGHALLFPLVPMRTPAQSVAHAFGLMRWDADEDREMKDTYSNLKENRGKSHTGLQDSFVKDYLLWLTKEAHGYRVLSKEKYRWFKWQIAKEPTF